ncbi:MAG: response regulator [Methanoregula sp.]|jgi:DNA-binding response OmpR family regulator
MSNVLYVDDEPALLDIGKIFLEMSGHLRVDTAGTVEDALHKMKLKKFDAIISDYQMPDITGIEFLRYICSEYHDLPFILFTGRGREEIVIEVLNCGADFYL